MPAIEATAAETTTLSAPRQSSQLLQLLRLVLQGSTRELRRYLARGGVPNARVYQDPRFNLHVSSEEYKGPGAMQETSLLAMCCSRKWAELAVLLIDAGAHPDGDAGSSKTLSPMCLAALRGDIATFALLQSRGARVDCEGHTPLMVSCTHGTWKLPSGWWNMGPIVQAQLLYVIDRDGQT